MGGLKQLFNGGVGPFSFLFVLWAPDCALIAFLLLVADFVVIFPSNSVVLVQVGGLDGMCVW
jgi:hypothetical protein